MDWDHIGSVYFFHKYGHFNNILPTHRHGWLSLFLSSISFFNVFEFALWRSFTPLVKFIPKHLNLYLLLWMGLTLSFMRYNMLYESCWSLCVNFFYPATLPNTLKSSNNLLVSLYWGSCYLHTEIIWVPLVCIIFICFSCLMALVKRFRTI